MIVPKIFLTAESVRWGLEYASRHDIQRKKNSCKPITHTLHPMKNVNTSHLKRAQTTFKFVEVQDWSSIFIVVVCNVSWAVKRWQLFTEKSHEHIFPRRVNYCLSNCLLRYLFQVDEITIADNLMCLKVSHTGTLMVILEKVLPYRRFWSQKAIF